MAVLASWPVPHNEEAQAGYARLPGPPRKSDLVSPLAYFFGWPVTPDWLDIFAQCARATPALHAAGFTDSDYGLEILKKLTGPQKGPGYFDLSLELVVHPESPSHWNEDSEARSLLKHAFKIASVRSTISDVTYFCMKPTVAQYAWLCAVMPGEPGWYKGVATKKEFVDAMRILDIPVY